MSAEFKPGDRVRVTSNCENPVIRGKEGRFRHYSRLPEWPLQAELDDDLRFYGFKHGELEPAPAAPAAELEMRDSMAHAICAELRGKECLGCPGKVSTPYGSGVHGCRLRANAVADALEAIIARHLAERDARIAELERTATSCNETAAKATKTLARLSQKLTAAEAALAEPTEDQIELAHAETGIPRATLRASWRIILRDIRSRSITSEAQS